VVLYFSKSHSATRDPGIAKAIREEGSGILNRLLGRLPVILGMSSLPPGGKESQRVQREIEKTLDPCLAWLKRYATLVPGFREPQEDITETMEEYLRLHDLLITPEKPKTKGFTLESFKKKVRKRFGLPSPEQVSQPADPITGKRPKPTFWFGIKLTRV
jgi:hypothetical protein